VPGNSLLGYWKVENPDTGYYSMEMRDSPVEMAATLTVPARVARPNGKVDVTFYNLGGRNFETSVMVPHDDVALLYRAGGFELNFVRGLLLILLQVVFLAALGTFASSFLSFPVACLVCLTIFCLGVGKEFLTDALTIRELPGMTSELFTRIGHYALKGMHVLLPDFQQTSPADSLIDGAYIPWRFLALSMMPAIVARVLLVLAAAFLIFHRRELAKVQV